jgi:hypothetical protein
MENSENWFRLPEAFKSSGDPVEGNPFPEGTAKHDLWADATRVAEEQFSRLIEAFLKNSTFQEKPPDGLAFDQYLTWLRGQLTLHEEGIIHLTAGKFDIWAYRYIAVTWTERDIGYFDEWLYSTANGWLDVTAKLYADAPSDVSGLLFRLRKKLMERIEHWKAEARKYAGEVQRTWKEAAQAGAERTNAMKANPNGATESTASKEADVELEIESPLSEKAARKA